ncbi:MAG TPA: sugar ABC transporter substrate-binding protein [Anaerolineaceae bacterium]|jgi:ABC-type glycerol-3-phosphate transport system substrate-binding protein
MLKYRLFSVIVVVAMLLGACAPAAAPTAAPAAVQPTTAPAQPQAAPTQPPAAVPATAPAAAAPSTDKLADIVVACWSGPEHDNLVKLAAAYTAKTGNKVTVEEIARESYQDKLTTTFVAGGSDYDVAYVSSDWPPAWINANALQNLDQYFTDPSVVDKNFDIKNYQPAINTFVFGGKTYAFPSEGDTAWMWYRKDLLAAKNIAVPQTWDEYLAAAKALNNPPQTYGAVIGAKPDEALWDFMFYLYSFGGDILDKNNKVILNNDAGVAALTFYSNLLRTEKVVPPDVNTYGYNEILTALQEGKAAMGIEWMAATQTLTDCTQSPKVCKDGQPLLGYTFVPGYKQADGTVVHGTGGSSWGWVIPSGSKNGKAAYKFIEWLTGPEGGKMWALNGGIPSNQLALTDPEVAQKIPQFKMLGEVMPIRHLVPSTTVTGDMVTAIDEAVVAAVTGTKDPKAALDDAAVKITDMLTKAGYIK